MEDFQIVDLYWQRNENAIRESDVKYGKLLCRVSYSLVSSDEDAEECVNDTYLAAWNKMPTDRPVYLGSYLTKIVRNISISRFRSKKSEKRGGAAEILEELSECIADRESVESQYMNRLLAQSLNRFVASLDEEKRAIFIRRYYYSQSIADISDELRISESKIKAILFRLRASLKNTLEREELL